MKKFLLNLILALVIVMTATVSSFASTKNQLNHDFMIYTNEIDSETKKIIKDNEKDLEALDKIFKDAKEKNKAVDKKAIDVLVKDIEVKNKELMNFLTKTDAKLKTKEFKALLKNTIKLLDLRFKFTREIIDHTVKNGKLDKDENAAILNKYGPEFTKIGQTSAEIFNEINRVLGKDITKEK